MRLMKQQKQREQLEDLARYGVYFLMEILIDSLLYILPRHCVKVNKKHPFDKEGAIIHNITYILVT